MSKSLSSTLRGTNYGTLPVLNGGTGVTTSTGTTNLVLSNGPTLDSPRILTVALIGPSTAANLTRFPNSLTAISNTAAGIQKNEAHNIGLVAEGTAHATDTSIYGVGVYGKGYTNAATRSGGVVGEGHVSATGDTGSAIGVRGYAHDTHAGGMNIGLYADASNGANNYALYMNSGNITNIAAQTWTLGGNLTFSGAYSVTIPTLSLGNALPVASGGTGATSAAAALTALGAQATLSAANGTTNGYLTSADWNTFNSKQAALGTASASVSGILSSTDWSTFNGKQAALVSGTNIKTVNGTTLLGSGDLVVTGGASATKTIANKTAAYTVVAGDLGTIINFTGSASATIALTAAATLGAGFTCAIWNTSSTFGAALTIDPNLTETVGTYTTYILRPGEGVEIVCDGTKWQTSSKKGMNAYAENWNGWNRPVAAGNASMAFGDGSATGNQSFAHSLYTGAGNASATNVYGWAVGMNSAGAGSVTATGLAAMALGGSYASGTDSFAAAIANNTSTYGATDANAIAIGKNARAFGGPSCVAIGNNCITGSYNGVAVGQSATASGFSSTALGNGPFATNTCSLAIGANSGFNSSNAGGAGAIALNGGRAYGSDSIAFSYGALSTQSGKHTLSSGIFAAVGDAQYGKIVLRAATTTTTAVVLTSDNAAATTTNQLILAAGQAMAIQGTLIAKVSGTGEMAGWNITGIVSNNGGTMAVSGLALTAIGSDSITLGAQPTIAVDTTNKGVKITSGYKSATNIRWVATLNTSEVVY